MYTPSDKDMERLNNNFVYHSPKDGQQERYIKLRDAGREYAKLVLENVPPSRERQCSLTAIEESNFWANAGIARNE